MKKAIKLGTMEDMPLNTIVDYTGEAQDVLDLLRKTIHCDLVEVVHPRGLKQPYIMVVDEEGALKDGNYINPLASLLYGFPIYGSAAIVRTDWTDDGKDIALLDDSDIVEVERMLSALTRHKN